MSNTPIRDITKIGIVLIFAICVAWDIFAYLTERNSSISVVITDWSFYTPWIPFIAGCLAGHWWFAPMGSKNENVD